MRWLFRYEGDKNFSLMKHTPLLFNSSALRAGVNSVRLHIFWRFQKRICDLRSYGFFTAKKMEDPKTEDHLPWQRQPPPQALRFSHGKGERETRVTGDEPQGTMESVQTAGEAPSRPSSSSRLPLRAHRKRDVWVLGTDNGMSSCSSWWGK